MSQARKKPRLELEHHRSSKATSSSRTSADKIGRKRKPRDTKLRTDASKFSTVDIYEYQHTINNTLIHNHSSQHREFNSAIKPPHHIELQDLTPDEIYERKVAGIIYGDQDRNNNSDKADLDHKWTNDWQSFYGNIDKVIKANYGHDDDDLPPDWIAVVHTSGAMVYFHKPTLNHCPPTMAIPCLHSITNEEMPDETSTSLEKQETSQIHSKNASQSQKVIDSETLQNYLGGLFDMEVIDVKETQKFFQTEPDITCSQVSISPTTPKTKMWKQHKPWNEKEALNKCITSTLVDYCQRVLSKRIKFKIVKKIHTGNYVASAVIGDETYGVGTATNKKDARQKAAESAFRVLNPEFYENYKNSKNADAALKFNEFNSLSVSDSKIVNIQTLTDLPKPAEILKECFQRNSAFIDLQKDSLDISNEYVQSLSLFRCVIRLGKHRVVVKNQSKEKAQQIAALDMLKLIHPTINTWGTMVMLYCNRKWIDKSRKKAMESNKSSNVTSDNDTSILSQVKESMRNAKSMRRDNNENYLFNPYWDFEF